MADELRKKIIGSLSRVQMYYPDEVGESSIEEEADKLVALITQSHLALLDELEKEKPEPKEETVSYSEDSEGDAYVDGHIAGFNDALSEIDSVFNNKRKELEK